MKRTTQLILVLTICSLSLLSACGGGTSTDVTTPPNANHLVEFNEEGIAVLRGHLSSGSFSSTVYSIKMDVPIKVEGMEAKLAVPFNLRADTEISSSLTTHTNVREYLTFNPGSTALDAFGSYALVDITFVKKGAAFEATAIRESTQKWTLFQKKAVIDNVFSMDDFSQQGVFNGSIFQSLKQNDGTITWQVAMPIDMQGVEVAVILPVRSAADTQVITKDGVVPLTTKDPWGDVQIQFIRSGDTLTARQVTEISQ